MVLRAKGGFGIRNQVSVTSKLCILQSRIRSDTACHCLCFVWEVGCSNRVRGGRHEAPFPPYGGERKGNPLPAVSPPAEPCLVASQQGLQDRRCEHPCSTKPAASQGSTGALILPTKNRQRRRSAWEVPLRGLPEEPLPFPFPQGAALPGAAARRKLHDFRP